MVLRCRLAGLYYFTRNAFALKGENMKIIIVGCGKVGAALTAQLSREDNLVTVSYPHLDVYKRPGPG